MPSAPTLPPAERRHARPAGQRLLLLRWLMLAAATALALLAGLHHGLLDHLLQADSTRLTLVIAGLTLLALAHGGAQAWRLARVLDQAASLELHLAAAGDPAGTMPAGAVGEHLAALAGQRGAAATGAAPPDPRPLQEAFAARIGKGCGLGWFTADLLASLGLLGTVIGFILMLAPLATLDAADAPAMKAALAAMSAGMGIALYTTLAGLAGGMILRLQGYLLDAALAEILCRTALLAERHRRAGAPLETRHAA